MARSHGTEMPAAKVKTILDTAAARLSHLPNGRRDAELLLLRAAERDRAWILTHADAELTPQQITQFESWIARRARHEPVQYILGETEFFGLTFQVTPVVLIPRPETEHLVEAAIERVPRDAQVRICDVGTGSGCIAASLAHALTGAAVTAVDISAGALQVARRNAERHGVAERVRWVESDLLLAVAGERFDMVVANPPYVRNAEILEEQVREYEPHAALFAGPTGVEAYERLIPQAREVLVPGGWLLMEIGQGQRDAVAGLLAGWDAVRFNDDLQGIPRIAIARRRA